MSAIIPISRVPITVRDATPSDLPFIDRLQKQHSKMVGFMPGKQLEGKIAAGEVLIAEQIEPQRHGGTEALPDCERASVSPCLRGESLGYCISRDQYFKHDDVGIIYQLNVVPNRQRGLIGATLIKSVFERAAYGCRLFCCWCAQDIEANRFWESLGFVPLAFRAGSRGKGRIHIFWERRIREGDTTTQWWFPAKTDAGSMREDRLVLPIPPGFHWSDELPRVLPQEKLIEDRTREPKALAPRKPARPRYVQAGPPPTGAASETVNACPEPGRGEKPVVEKPKRETKPKAKIDRKYIAAARELNARWQEWMASGEGQVMALGKYDVSTTKRLTASKRTAMKALLPAA